MGSPAALPVIAPRQPKPKPPNQDLHEIIPVIQPLAPKKTSHTPTPPKNYSSRLTSAEWEEIRDILRPGLPFNFFHHNSSSNNSKNANSTLPYSPQPHQSLKVLGVCLSVLLLSLIILCCRFCWDKRRRKGYSAAPSHPPENPSQDDDDVIAEVVNRREQTPVNPTKSQTSQKSLYYNPSKAKSDNSSNKVSPSPSSKSVTKDPSSHSSGKNDGAKFLTERRSEPSLFKLRSSPSFAKKAAQSPSTPSVNATAAATICSLHEAKHVKLIPVENLVIPRTFNDALEKAFPDLVNTTPKVDIDTVLSLSSLERSLSKPNLVLKPIPTNSKMHISVEPDIPEEAIDALSPGAFSSFKRPPPLPFQRDDLSPEQKEEERLKFLRACWKTEMRRRRSLCSISNNEVLVDPKLYNSIVHSAGSHYSARKAKSMPTMSFVPFANLPKSHPTPGIATYSTDALGKSPMWSPPSLVPNPEPGLRSGSSSVSSNFQDDWQNLRKPESFSTKSFSTPQEANAHTSVTSIWSTVASENTMEAYHSEDDDIVTEDEFQLEDKTVVELIKLELIKADVEQEKDKIPTILTSPPLLQTIHSVVEDDDPGDKLPETKTERKKSLSCMDFILEAAKSTTNPIANQLDNTIVSNESMTLESDRIPSEIFAVYRKSKPSTTSEDSLLGEEYSISRLFDKSPSSFWDIIDVRDYQMIGGESGMVSRRTIDAGSGTARTTHNGTTPSQNKIDPNHLLNNKKVNVKSPAHEEH